MRAGWRTPVADHPCCVHGAEFDHTYFFVFNNFVESLRFLVEALSNWQRFAIWHYCTFSIAPRSHDASPPKFRHRKQRLGRPHSWRIHALLQYVPPHLHSPWCITELRRKCAVVKKKKKEVSETWYIQIYDEKKMSGRPMSGSVIHVPERIRSGFWALHR